MKGAHVGCRKLLLSVALSSGGGRSFVVDSAKGGVKFVNATDCFGLLASALSQLILRIVVYQPPVGGA